MISLPLPLKNLWNNTLSLETEITTTKEEKEKPFDKFSISIKEMQTISCALLIYAKHLEKRTLAERATNAKALEERIFDYLQTMG